jgi:peptidoglycan hydrolase CwlO-like protein
LTITLRRKAMKRTFTITSAQSSKAQFQKHKGHNMKYDRNYFRMLDDDSLINEGRDSMDELAIVLADRLGELSDVEAQLDEAKNEIDELNKRLTILTEELNTLENDQ